MATDTEQLILSISADTAQIKRALARLPDDAKKSAAGISSAFSRVDPVGKMQQNLSRSMRAVSADAKVLSFQLNDIATGLSTGQSPFTVMNQQLGQITQTLGGQGVLGALTVLRGAFATAWPTLALLAATTALQYFFSEEKDGSKKAEQAAEAHAAALRKIADAYEGILPALDRYVKRQEDALNLSKDTDTLKAEIASINEAIDDAWKDLDAGEALAELFVLIQQNAGELAAVIQDDLLKSIIKFQQAQVTGKGAQEAWNELIAKAAAVEKQYGAGTTGISETLAAMTRKIRENIEALKLQADALDVVQGKVDQFNAPGFLSGAGGPGGVDLTLNREVEFAAGTADVELTRAMLKSRAATKHIADSLDNLTDEAVKAFGKLFSILPETARITSGVRTRAEQAAAYARYKSGQGGLAAPPGRSRHEVGGALDIGAGVDMETLREAVQRTRELETLKGRAYEVDKVHVQLKGTSARLDEEAADAAERLAEKQGNALVQLEKMLETEAQEIALKERINVINANLTLTEDERALAIARVTAEAAKEAEVEKHLAQAEEAGMARTPALIAKYNAIAQAKVNAIIQDKQLAITQRDAAKATQEQQRAIEQFNQQVSQMAQSAIGGLINDLRNGVEAGEAFNNMLNRIIDSLIQMALQSVFSPTGAGGGFLSNLFGVAHSGGIVGKTAFPQRQVSPLVFAGAPRFASGGMVGLRSGEVPIIAHRGEMIIPKNMVGRAGVGGDVNNHIGSIAVGVNTGPDRMVATTDDGKKLGAEIDRAVQHVIVRESRPGGLLRRAG